ncbi:collagen alpha-1(XXIII) chain-like [Clytia hemisphaerica]|uniref:collagen alpha-1(XXIII) chain-like n=1 Tax=Clytia hemisphaerica TaxID=252671 RepID=UPI0034D737C9
MKKVIFFIQILLLLGSTSSTNEVRNKEAPLDTKSSPKKTLAHSSASTCRAGRDGRDGLNGLPGRDGEDGCAGQDGRDGLPGVRGPDGVQGIQGRPGSNGTKGDQGVPGKDGKDGINGVPGVNGTKGEQGPPGKDHSYYRRNANNDHIPFTMKGVCKINKSGVVSVGLNVGKCNGGYQLGDAVTGWYTVTRIIIEEL